MDWFLLFGLIGFGLIICGFIGYSISTNKIIKEQEDEIEVLESEYRKILKKLNEKRVDQAVPDRFKR